MKKDTVRVSIDFSEEDHILLKMKCAKSRKAIKDYIHDLTLQAMRKEIEQQKEVEFQGMLKESLQQAKDGKVREISFKELDEMFKNAQ